jgi:hypothetical protein
MQLKIPQRQNVPSHREFFSAELTRPFLKLTSQLGPLQRRFFAAVIN